MNTIEISELELIRERGLRVKEMNDKIIESLQRQVLEQSAIISDQQAIIKEQQQLLSYVKTNN